jgi:hypothetical protein
MASGNEIMSHLIQSLRSRVCKSVDSRIVCDLARDWTCQLPNTSRKLRRLGQFVGACLVRFFAARATTVVSYLLFAVDFPCLSVEISG